ncbi:MAG TPA: hypothetical protein VKT22_00975 [Steroidobacteraceae bacterium]|nr:hypothetical protein [Steroidobacteraceae bacterium]
MNAALALRLGAVIELLLGLGHGIGYPWEPAAPPASPELLGAVRTLHFDVLGVSRSYFDFHVGFGWMLEAYLLAHAILFWQLGALASHERAAMRAIVGVLLLESLALTVLAAVFLFWIPTLMSGLIATCLAIAWIRLGRPRVAQSLPAS